MKQEKDFRRDELLEMLWHLTEEHEVTLSELRSHDPTEELEKSLLRFASNGVLAFDGENIHLTAKGSELARGIIRRHRLAERLMTDVLGEKVANTEAAACEFEHLLAPELVNAICILLGHPKRCPHGSPIPPGRCCREALQSVQSAVIPLTQMEIGASAKIASINTGDENRMHKLFSMGLTPGTVVRLHQTYPALVLELDQRQIALEESIGADINVWKPAESGHRK